MPRCKNRARKIRARVEAEIAERKKKTSDEIEAERHKRIWEEKEALRKHFENQLEDRWHQVAIARNKESKAAAMQAFINLLAEINASALRLWSFHDHIENLLLSSSASQEDIEAALAMIAQLVEKRLSASTRGSVYRLRPWDPNEKGWWTKPPDKKSK